MTGYVGEYEPLSLYCSEPSVIESKEAGPGQRLIRWRFIGQTDDTPEWCPCVEKAK